MSLIQVIIDEMERQLDRAGDYMIEPGVDMDKARFYIGGCSALVDTVRRARIDVRDAVMTSEQFDTWNRQLEGLNALEKQLQTGKPFDTTDLLNQMFGKE